jgi:O-antigen ligase
MAILSKLMTSDNFFKHRYYSGANLGGTSLEKIASWLFISDFLFMTRFYAMSNLVETLLFGIFLLDSRLRNEFIRTIKDPSVCLVLLFFAWCLISGLWSSASWVEVLNDWWGWRKLLLFPIGLVLLSNPRAAEAAFRTFFLVGILFITLCYLSWAFDIEKIWSRPYTQMVQNHNAQGVFFCFLAMCLNVLAKTFDRKCTYRWIALIISFSLLFMVGWLGTSRTGYVSFIICVLVSMIFWFGFRWRAFFVGLILSGAIVAVSPIANERIAKALHELALGEDAAIAENNSGGIRVVMWKNTAQIISENWLLGVGAADFESAYSDQVAGTIGWTGIVSNDPHNQYLHILAEYGLVGLILFGGAVFTLMARVNSSHWGMALLGLLLIGLVVSLFNSSFGSSVEGRILQLGFALLLSLDRHHKLGKIDPILLINPFKAIKAEGKL